MELPGMQAKSAALFSAHRVSGETTGHGSVPLNLVADIDPVDFAEAGLKEE